MRLITSLAILQLYALGTSALNAYGFLNSYTSCSKGIWECASGQQCVFCSTSRNFDLGNYCSDPPPPPGTALLPGQKAALCGFRNDQLSCDSKCSAPGDNLDVITGLDYVTGLDSCNVDSDCTGSGRGQQCASCFFQAFDQKTPRYGTFCYDQDTIDITKKYCDPGVNHNLCTCGDEARKSLSGFPSEQSGLGGQLQSPFAEVPIGPTDTVNPEFGFVQAIPITNNPPVASTEFSSTEFLSAIDGSDEFYDTFKNYWR